MKIRPINYLFVILITFIAMAGCQQKQTFILTGQLEGITNGKAIMTQFTDDNQEPDTVIITDGKFVLEGNFPEPTHVELMVEDHDIPKYFYVENAVMTLTGHADTLYSATIIGGEVNDDEKTYMDGTMELYKKHHLDSLYKIYFENRDEELMAQIEVVREDYDADVEKYEFEFIKKNPSAYYSAILAKQISFGLSADEIGDIIALLSSELQNSELISGVVEEMEMLRETDVSVESFTNNVPDVDYLVDESYPGKPHTSVKYLASFPNDDICALKNDGTISIIGSNGIKKNEFKTDMIAKPSSIAIDPASGLIYVLGTLTETKEAKFRGKTHKQEVMVGVECLIYDAKGKKVKIWSWLM